MPGIAGDGLLMMKIRKKMIGIQSRLALRPCLNICAINKIKCFILAVQQWGYQRLALFGAVAGNHKFTSYGRFFKP